MLLASRAHAMLPRVIDLQGNLHDLAEPDRKVTVIVFTSTECPISNRYVPTLNEIVDRHAGNSVGCFAVVSDATLSRSALLDWHKSYAPKFKVIFDPAGDVARMLKPTRTPEAFVLNTRGDVVYRGRIDNAYQSLGKMRQVVDEHDLADAIESALNDWPAKTPRADAVGCTFESRNPATRPAPVTFTRDVAPILYANCVSCHRPGEVAPFPLLSYDDAAKRADLLADVTGSRYMPPWKPAEGFGQFRHQRRLTDLQISTLDAWAKSNAPRGDDAELPPAPAFSSGWTLGEPDLVLEMPESFDIPAAGRDVYRAFVLPADIPEDKMIAGFEFKAGNPKVVHHCLLFLDNSGAARKLDAADDVPGYRSFGGPGFIPSGGLGGWAPGSSPYLLKEGTARPLAKGADIVLQMHYHPSGKPESDRSRLALYFAKKPVERIVSNIPLITRDIDIAPGDSNYSRIVSLTLPIDVTVTGAFPHMHLIGREMKVTAAKPDGTLVPLIWIKDWDFRWQDQYQYQNEIALPKGTKLTMTASYDNSTNNPSNPSNPPKRIRHGEQTTDEMCLCFIQFASSNPQDVKTLRNSLIVQRLGQKLLNGR